MCAYGATGLQVTVGFINQRCANPSLDALRVESRYAPSGYFHQGPPDQQWITYHQSERNVCGDGARHDFAGLYTRCRRIEPLGHGQPREKRR